MSLTELPKQKTSLLDFLSGGGEMGERIRNFDWSKTTLGLPENWSQSLKTSISICLNSNFPIAIYWGKELTLLYNDAWSPIPGNKHPWALGNPAKKVWPEIWNDIEPQFQKAFQGKPGGSKDALLPMQRHGYTEECYFDFTFTPVYGDSGKVEGVFNAVIETTYRILNERRSKFLNELTVQLSSDISKKELLERIIPCIYQSNKSIPFAFLYKVEKDVIELVSSTVENTSGIFKEQWPFDQIPEQEKIYYINNPGTYLRVIPKGYWPEEPVEAVIIPCKDNNNTIHNYLVCGVNPRHRYDNEFKIFFENLSDIVNNSLRNALSIESERLRAEALEELDKAKTVFFSNISHEFRTPLTLLLGTVEEVLQDPNTVPKNIEKLNITHRNAMRLLKLVNTLLDFSRIESGRQKAIYSLTDIVTLTKNLASNFRSIVEKGGLELIVKAEGIIQPVYIDRQMWEKIVFNLLSNAFKYTLKGKITVRLLAEKNNLVLEVEDTGVGIPEKELPHLFERFYRVQNITGRTYEGTGIGLSLIKELVQLHGGMITVKSSEGIGSLFTVRIPFGKDHLPAEQIFDKSYDFEDVIGEAYIEEAASLIEEKQTDHPDPIKKESDLVLVVDDNSDMRGHLESLLKKHYSVITAVNGLDALQKLETAKPSLILSDIMMPEMDGVQLLKTIRDNSQYDQIPVILLTARAGEESRIEGYETGADDYLLKPFSSRELIARIAAQLKIKQKREAVFKDLYSVFDEVPFAVAVLKGKSLVIDFINKYNLEVWQQKKENVLGKPLFEVRPDLKENAGPIHSEIYKTGKRFTADEIPVNITYQGKTVTRYFNAVIDPMFDEKGQITGQLATSIEVTEQVLARKKVEESEKHLELLSNTVPALIFYLDTDQRFRSCNNAFTEWFGVKQQEVIGVSVKEFVGEKAWQIIAPNLAKAYSGEVVEYEAEVPYRLGGTRWTHPVYTPHKNEKGEVIGIVVLITDITNQKRSEQRIKESEERNRLFIEYAPAAMAMFDKEMRYVSVSKQWMKEYDLSGNIIGKKHYELFPNILQRWKDSHARCMKGAVERSDADFYVKDDGTPVWLKWEVHPWYTSAGEIGGIVIFTENITERNKAQQSIKESEERFRTMANEAPLFVWETDKNLQTTYLNKAGLEYFNLDESLKLSQLSWKKYIHPDDLERVLSTMHSAAAKHESYTLEMRLKNGLTGKYHWFLDKGAPLYKDENFIGFIGTSLDIHERKENEKELEGKVKERTSELAGQNILLQKQNELVKKIFDASVHAIAVYDTETRIITLNQASLDLARMKEEDMIGKKLLEALPQMEGSKGHRDLLKAISGETVHNKIYYSELSGRYLENFLMPLKDENGNVYAVLAMAHDNTELIAATEKLKEAQQIAQVGHWDWNVSTGDLTWSDNLYKIYGLDAQESISYEKFISLVHPDDRTLMQENISNALQTKTYNDFFHRIITPAGEEKIMHARGGVIVDKDGKISRMVGTGQDVTKQKMIEKELIETSRKIEERNQFIEQLINSSLDLIIVIDKDLRFITMNKKAQKVYKNFYKDEIIGKKVTEVAPPVKGTESLSDLQQAFTGKIVIKEKAKSTISEKYYEHNLVPLTNPAGEVYAVMIISHDITESTKRMEELRKLYESDEQKNNFIAMASHELKTPITSIKGYVQLLLNALEKEKGNEKPLPPLLVRSSLISVDKQIKRLTRLISELLDISKIETGTLDLKKEKFSLNELAIETVEDILYTNTKHSINLYHECQGNIYGDKDRIGQVMINFLTNAIKYSPDSDKIDIMVHRISEKEIGFSVKDYGIGIEKSEQKKIFERFYRAKGKEEQTYPGFGIGLFIANEFIQKHGGHVWVESEKGKGSTFTFALPIHNE